MSLDKIKIEDCDFSVRVINAMERSERYYTLADLHQATDAELMRVPNIGARSVREIRDLLALCEPPPVDNSDVMKWAMKHPNVVRAMIQLEREIYQLMVTR